jgi:hypothetical protein
MLLLLLLVVQVPCLLCVLASWHCQVPQLPTQQLAPGTSCSAGAVCEQVAQLH